jgi:hypothetical protein
MNFARLISCMPPYLYVRPGFLRHLHSSATGLWSIARNPAAPLPHPPAALLQAHMCLFIR